MLAQTRAIVAAAAFALVTGRKVAGVHDHATSEDLRIAAEARGDRVQAADGDRDAKFGGTLPELYDSATKNHVSMAIEGRTARGHDRASGGAYEARVLGQDVVQVYDHALETWFTYDIRGPEADAYRSQADAQGS